MQNVLQNRKLKMSIKLETKRLLRDYLSIEWNIQCLKLLLNAKFVKVGFLNANVFSKESFRNSQGCTVTTDAFCACCPSGVFSAEHKKVPLSSVLTLFIVNRPRTSVVSGGRGLPSALDHLTGRRRLPSSRQRITTVCPSRILCLSGYTRMLISSGKARKRCWKFLVK